MRMVANKASSSHEYDEIILTPSLSSHALPKIEQPLLINQSFLLVIKPIAVLQKQPSGQCRHECFVPGMLERAVEVPLPLLRHFKVNEDDI